MKASINCNFSLNQSLVKFYWGGVSLTCKITSVKNAGANNNRGNYSKKGLNFYSGIW